MQAIPFVNAHSFHRSAVQEKSIRPILNVESILFNCIKHFAFQAEKAKQHVPMQQSEGDTQTHTPHNIIYLCTF